MITATSEAPNRRFGDDGITTTATPDTPVHDDIVGWPVNVSVFDHPSWTPYVEVSRWPEGHDPEGNPENNWCLTARGARALAEKLLIAAELSEAITARHAPDPNQIALFAGGAQ
jgi:hypothetical protein